MGKYQLEYDALNEISKEFLAMDNDLKARIKGVAQKIGDSLKKNTEAAIPRAAKAKHGIHLADEVKMSVSVTDKSAKVTVKGGPKTGGFWWIVDNGHVAKNGKFVPGAHFTDKAYNATEVEGPVDALVREILHE